LFKKLNTCRELDLLLFVCGDNKHFNPKVGCVLIYFQTSDLLSRAAGLHHTDSSKIHSHFRPASLGYLAHSEWDRNTKNLQLQAARQQTEVFHACFRLVSNTSMKKKASFTRAPVAPGTPKHLHPSNKGFRLANTPHIPQINKIFPHTDDYRCEKNATQADRQGEVSQQGISVFVRQVPASMIN
jgi:hypothetical protein